MGWLRRFRRRSDEDYAAEIDAHLAHEIDERVARGVAPDEARYAALRAFGNVTRHIERFRESSPWFRFETVWNDARYGWRSLVRSRSLFVAAVLTLAIGIGGSAAFFSIFYATIVNPLPFREGDRLAVLVQYDPTRTGAPRTAHIPATDFPEYARLPKAFSGVAGVAWSSGYINGFDLPPVDVLEVTCNFFDVLGVVAALGRAPVSDDCRPGATPVVVIGHRLWQTRFAADPAIVGRMVRVERDGESLPRTIIGVMAERVVYWQEDAWVPSPPQNEHAGLSYRSFVARLQDDAQLQVVAPQVAAMAARLAAARPAMTPGAPRPYGLESLHGETVRDSRATMSALGAGMAGVVMLAILNVLTLLVARATARGLEMGVRNSLGASRGRITMQLMVESLVLAVCGGLGGLALAAVAMPPLASLFVASGAVADIRLHWPALAVSAAALAVATLVFGVVTAVVAVRCEPALTLAGVSRGADPDLGRWRSALVAGQVAVALPVVCLASAVGISLVKLETAAGAYQPSRVLEVWPTWSSVGEKRYPSLERLEQLLRDVEGAIGAVPGVTAVANTLPALMSRMRPTDIQLVDRSDRARWQAQVRLASPTFFRTMNVPVLEGRALLDADEVGRHRVAVVTRRFVTAYLRGQSPIGRRLQVTGPVAGFGSVGADPFEIVGVVGDIPLPEGNDDAVGIVPVVFVPRAMASVRMSQILVRTAVPAGTIERDIRKAIARVDGGMVIESSVLQTGIDRWWTSWPRLVVTIASAFAAIATALVFVGVFGALSYTIAQRRREIGVRMALGASPGQIAIDVVFRGLRWTGVGVLVGIMVARVALGAARSQVWGLATLDQWVVTSVAVAMLLVVGVTAWIPARRAARIDPVAILRAE